MFSNTAEYALRAVMHLASATGRPRAAKEIAEAAKIPAGYVSKVLQDLARAGILDSRRGPSGGFRLARDPGKISVLEVINAVDPIQRIVKCPLDLPEHSKRLCRLHQELDDAIATVEKTLSEATFADMLAGDRKAPKFQFPTIDQQNSRSVARAAR
ncbi:MAG TPA: Rrf2 family transcriptional regulator [Phycisphaerales bacterium]|nr:Rrf2 family transcriptional regulator [Phycisphaerales bacterium]